jgi:hypothetical protein
VTEDGQGGRKGKNKRVPKDLPRGNAETVIPEVIPANVREPEEAALPAARNRKCA